MTAISITSGLPTPIPSAILPVPLAPTAETPADTLPFIVQLLAATGAAPRKNAPTLPVVKDDRQQAPLDEGDKKTPHQEGVNQQWLDALLLPTSLPVVQPAATFVVAPVQVDATVAPRPIVLSPGLVALPLSKNESGVQTDTPPAAMQPNASSIVPVLASLPDLPLPAKPRAGESEGVHAPWGEALNAVGSTSPLLPTSAADSIPAPKADVRLTLHGNGESLAQQLGNALGERLKLQIDNHVQHASIKLYPAEMGKIDISLHFEAGKLSVQINAGQQDVYRALQQTSNELRQNLLQHNVQVEVQVSSQQQPPMQQQHSQKKPHAQAENIVIARALDDENPTSDSDGSILLTI